MYARVESGFSRTHLPRANRQQPTASSELLERLIDILQQVFRVLEADGDSGHAGRHAGALQFVLGVPPLGSQHRQAAEALDAAEAGGALDDFEAVEHLVCGRLSPLTSTHTIPPNPDIWRAAMA